MSDPISNHQIRPRFRIELTQSPEEIFKKLESEMAKKEVGIYGTLIEGHATLSLPQKDQHYWSPQLSLTFEASNGGSLLRGMYSPRPEVWTLFVLFYSFIGFMTMVISIIGYSNWSLGQSAQILWLVPAFVGIFLTLYLVSYFGQKMGRKQILTLHDFVERTLEVRLLE